MRPKFDPKEEYLIAYYRTGSASGAGWTWTYDIVILIVGIGLFLIGFIGDRDPIWSLIGLGMLAHRIVQSALACRKYDIIFTSIVEKYEAALENPTPPQAAMQVTNGSQNASSDQ